MGSAYDMASQVSWWGQALSIPLIFCWRKCVDGIVRMREEVQQG